MDGSEFKIFAPTMAFYNSTLSLKHELSDHWCYDQHQAGEGWCQTENIIITERKCASYFMQPAQPSPGHQSGGHPGGNNTPATCSRTQQRGKKNNYIINPLVHVDISLSLVYCVILSHHHSHVNMLREGRVVKTFDSLVSNH